MKRYERYKPSGIEWIGEIPEHWHIERVKWIFFETKEVSKEGNEELLSVSEYYGIARKKEMIGVDDILVRANTLEGYKVVRKGDLVINIMLAWKRGLGISDYDGIVSPAYCAYRLKKDYTPRYFHYLYRTDLYVSEFRRNSTGIIDSRLRMYSEDFFRIMSIIPPTNEQTSIANYLDRKTAQIDDLIAKKQKLIDLLNEEKTVIINQAVTKGLDPNTPTKDSGIPLLGEMPKHWDAKKLKYVSVIKSSNVDKKSYDDEKKVLLCNYLDVYKHEFIDNSFSFMEATANENEIAKFSIKKGDVLVTKDSETPDDIASPAYIKEDLENVICGYHLAQIRANNIEIIGEYLFRLFQTKKLNSHFEVSANGVTRFGLSVDSFEQVLILLPPIKEQSDIIRHIQTEIEKIDATVSKVEKEIELLQEYRTALISEAVTGKIKVS